MNKIKGELRSPEKLLTLFFLTTSLSLSFISPAHSDVISIESSFTTFEQWCLNLDKLSISSKFTVETILESTSSDCEEEQKLIPLITKFGLRGFGINIDLRPISSLTNLAYLRVIGDGNIDLKPLLNLKKLEFLSLEHIYIEDLSHLYSLRNLIKLGYQDYRNETNLSLFKDMPKLKCLIINGSRIEGFESCEKLESARIYINGIEVEYID
jgi:Leucine-rich repeat (LRR) protein